VLPFLNRIRVLATMGSKRSRFLPNVPTLAESGFKDMVISETIGLYLPARTPDAQVQSLHAAMVKALASPEAVATLNTLGMERTPSSQAELRTLLKTEYEHWGPFIKQIGYQQSS
jgi:tripartite-type tricarboxylate transporter receptor subunit TctC